MGHQDQGGRRLEGRRAAVGRVAGEELAQPRVAEVPAQGAPHGVEGLHAPQRREAAESEGADQARQARPGPAEKGVLQQREHLGRFGAEAPVVARLRRPGESGDGVLRAGLVGEEIERAAVLPGMARQGFRAMQVDVRLEALADRVE